MWYQFWVVTVFFASNGLPLLPRSKWPLFLLWFFRLCVHSGVGSVMFGACRKILCLVYLTLAYGWCCFEWKVLYALFIWLWWLFSFFFQYVSCSVRSYLALYIEQYMVLVIRRGDKDIELGLLTSESDLYGVTFSHGRVSSKFHGHCWEGLVNHYGLRHHNIMTVS